MLPSAGCREAVFKLYLKALFILTWQLFSGQPGKGLEYPRTLHPASRLEETKARIHKA